MPAAGPSDRTDGDGNGDVDRTLTMQPGGTLQLKTFPGASDHRRAGDQVVIHAVRRATRDRLDDIKLEITQSGNTIEVDANHRLVERRNDNVVETDFEIRCRRRPRSTSRPSARRSR